MQAYVGYWSHSAEMQAKRRLPLALAQFGLLTSAQCEADPRPPLRAGARSARGPAGGGTAGDVEQAAAGAGTWWQRTHGVGPGLRVAYVSMEFAVDEALPIYSGGLGVLAGDHLKAAAELGVPIVGVGLLYRGGYFTQGIDENGRQTEDYHPVDPVAAGLVREPVTVEVDLADEKVVAAVWRSDVGSVPLYLLEVDWITDALYGGDREHRIRQELLLGVGGVRALAALGVEPTVYHLNEGHSAFLVLERVRALVEQGCRPTTRSSRCGRRPSSRRTRPSRPGTRSSPRSSCAATPASSPRRPGSASTALLALGRATHDDPASG